MVKHRILFVDDEVNVLNALERAFIAENEIKVFSVHTAQEGIRLLEQESIELVISDEKMPVVQGHQFLSYVKNKFPDVIRIILTGYADVPSILAAVNKGEVYRYLKKPWENGELVQTVKKALEFRMLQKKNEEMYTVIREQNKQLKFFNLDLENSVQERTTQLKKALLGLKQALTIRKFFSQMIDLCIAIISLTHKELAAHMLRVAGYTLLLLDELSISNEEKEQIIYAAYLHDIGLLNMPASYFTATNDQIISEEHRKIFFDHPAAGYYLMNAIQGMGNPREIIFAHHENYDGTGFPEKKWGDKIPLGARVIRLVSEYDELTVRYKKNTEQALGTLDLNSMHYDPELLPLFKKQIENKRQSISKLGFETTLTNLKAGMVLQENIFLTNGMLLFTQGKIIDSEVLKKIEDFIPLLNSEKSILVQYIQKGMSS